MKKKRIIITIILIFIIMIIPMRIQNKNGDIEYKAILYKYIKIHRPDDSLTTGYEDGWELKILGIYVAGETNVDIEALPIEVVKPELQNGNEFNIYLETDDRVIYMSSALEEIYYYTESGKYTLKYYITNTYQTLDDSIKNFISNLNLYGELNDGGTKIYKSKKSDTTVVLCHTIAKNNDIFIGDYNMQYDNEIMCKR